MEAASAGYNRALLSSRGFCVGIAAWSLGLGPAETARPAPFASVTGVCAGNFSRLPRRERGGLAVDVNLQMVWARVVLVDWICSGLVLVGFKWAHHINWFGLSWMLE